MATRAQSSMQAPERGVQTVGEQQTKERLEPIFRPRSVAVVGASNRVGSVGHDLFRNILLGGYCGTIYPVNPKAKSIEIGRAHV